MPGMENDVLVAKNVNFDYASNPPHNGIITADAQLLIGSVTTHPTIAMQAGNLISGDGSITINYVDPNLDIRAAGGTVMETLTPDEGGVISPVANNIDVKGFPGVSYPTDSIVTHKYALGVMGVENRRWHTAFVVDPSATIGVRGTYQTITAALAAATSGQTIYVRPGTYTENFTLKAGVNITGWPSDGQDSNSNIIIVGKVTHNTTGNCVLANLMLQTNSDFLLQVTGANNSTIVLWKCFLNGTNNTAIDASSSGSSAIRMFECRGTCANGAFKMWQMTNSTFMFLQRCDFGNAGSTTASTNAGTDNLDVHDCRFTFPLSWSSSGGGTFRNVEINVGSSNITAVTTSSTTSITFYDSFFSSGSASAISAGSSNDLELYNCSIDSTNTNGVTGAGKMRWGNLVMSQSNSKINTTTQTPVLTFPGTVNITSPGAYPYTAVPQDCLILVDTSLARTINLNASPATGQTYRIKDNVGSAGANNITITPAAGNIDGAGSASIASNYGSVDVTYNGTQWNIL